jgi:SAM-dependent methyltransferase
MVMSETPTGRDPAGATVSQTVQERMKSDWDRRAEEDYKLHIATGHAGSDETFRESGKHDLDEVILNDIDLDPAAEALEIGCGVGRLLVPLSERVAVAHGVDISDVMIRKSREYCQGSPRVRTQTTDGTLGHLADGSIDFVFSFIVFQHIPDRAAIATYVREAARVLRPGGLFRFQVDGRWRRTQRADWKATTYDGVKFSPTQVRELLVGTDFEVVDEWGAESHYHWITVRRRSEAPTARASFRRREMDRVLLLDLMKCVGTADPAAATQRIIEGKESLWFAIGPLQDELTAAPDELFVREAFRRLLGREPDAARVASQTDILKSHQEERSALIDTIVTGSGFRNLVCPIVPDLTWFRGGQSKFELGLPPEAGFFDLVDAVTSSLEGLAADKAIVNAFFLIRGDRPDGDGLRFYRERLDSHPLGRRLVVLQLLATPDTRSIPSPPARERLDALFARVGAGAAESACKAGESFPGEAVVAAGILERGRPLPDRDFVARAYETVLGRETDAGGLEFYSGKLTGREMSRTLFLRELLWSEELREPVSASR